ncbi:GIY-YIG nuclease family protein [Rhizobium laguerreae]|uniref:GIY-YIG nuclease family protein n=1 Tax=Rhizobium laguerreae TaxID=1076926 RepID=UPI001C925463
MHERFRAFTEDLHPKFEALMAQEPVVTGILPPEFTGSGIYMFSEVGESLYVGRTRDVRKRYRQHIRRSSGHNSAPFAFKLARYATGRVKAYYRPGRAPALACCLIRNLQRRSPRRSSAFAEWSSASCPNPIRPANASLRSTYQSSAAHAITTSIRANRRLPTCKPYGPCRRYALAISSRPSFSMMSTKLRTAAGLMMSLCPGA